MPVSVQKVGPKGQVTLPKHVRDALGLKTGDLVETVLGREGAITRPVELRLKKVDVKKRLEAAERAVKEGGSSGPSRRRAPRCVPSSSTPVRAVLTEPFVDSLIKAPPEIQNRTAPSRLRHPSLQAKRYDAERFQARVSQDLRFYYRRDADTYILLDLLPHPK